MSSIPRFEVHSHTEYSNVRGLDSINKVEDLLSYAEEIGLSGIAITDHEILSSVVRAKRKEAEIRKTNPDFKVAIGNEIYLCPNRASRQHYFHFILIAKNKDGYMALKELSSRAWLNMFEDRRIERVVTTYDDLKEIYNKYPKSLIGTTACLGGELSKLTAGLILAEKADSKELITFFHTEIIRFISFCKEIFGEDFYIECAPGCSKEQIAVNRRLYSIAECFKIKMVIGTDAHYLKKEDRQIHKSYLTSQNREREVDSFYEFSYLQKEEEIIFNLKESYGETIEEIYKTMCANSIEIFEKIEDYNIFHKQVIPSVEITRHYPKRDVSETVKEYEKLVELNNHLKTLCDLYNSDDEIERFWVNQCVDELKKKLRCGTKELFCNHKEYIERLEEEANIKKIIGEKLETNMFKYPVTLQYYCDMFWECGSIVGAGRGSSCSGLNHYLLGVTQLDPIEHELPFWRYLNAERTELGDIDIDLDPQRRPAILKRIKKERGQKFIPSIDELSRKNLGCTMVATFGTETAKSAVQTSCRGYRSEKCPDGVPVEEAQYLSTLIPVERGFVWDLKDVFYGNESKDRKPVTAFVNKVSEFPGLKEIMLSIEGLIKQRGTHASGIIFFDENPYEFGCFMRSPSGDVCTQLDLHDAEAVGMTKYDFLVTSVQTKIAQTIKLLQEYNFIPQELSLKEVYNKYLNPNIIDLSDEEVWKSIENGDVLNIFQFDSDVGAQAAKKIKPRNILELSDSNGLMRLMTAEKGAETPMDKYVRFKNNISLWYKEMENAGLTKREMKVLEPYFLSSYGVPPSQEQMMKMLMDPDICNFSLADANMARKIVGKKQMSKIPALREQVLNQATSPALGNYVWTYGIGPQMGYSFSLIHALAYSFIGYQTAWLGTHYPLFWNTACLIVNGGSTEDEDDEEDEDDDDKRQKGTKYEKNAKALGDICSKGINVSLININESKPIFAPDIKNNRILYGLKGVNRVGDDVVEKIIANRPYTGIKDFIRRCRLNKTIMIQLIKAGAFDELDAKWAEKMCPEAPRKAIMAYYIWRICKPTNKITLNNFPTLIRYNLIPDEYSDIASYYNLNEYLKKSKGVLPQELNDVFCNNTTLSDLIEKIEGDFVTVNMESWDSYYGGKRAVIKQWMTENEPAIIDSLNAAKFQELWKKEASGSLSYWEMESLCFYFHEHELAKVDKKRYGISSFNKLPSIPEVETYFKETIPIYKLTHIVGTVIAKNATKATVSLLTPDSGVVTVKLSKEYFAKFNKKLSEVGEDGKKHAVEEGWFKRGTKIFCTGFRRDDMFVLKSYSKTATHQLYKINNLNEITGELELVHERWDEAE